MAFQDIFTPKKNSTIPLEGEKTKKLWLLDPTTCFTNDEVHEVIEFVETRKHQSKISGKAWIYMIIGFYTGLRISEIANLKCKHIVLSGNALYPHIFVEHGKTKYSRRRIPLNNKVIEAILEYQKYKESWGEDWTDEEEPFLRSQKGEHYTRFGLFALFKRVLKNIKEIKNPKRFHPHSMRHSFGTFLYLSSNHDLRLVQELLGHSSIKISEIYITVINEHRISAIERLYGKK